MIGRRTLIGMAAAAVPLATARGASSKPGAVFAPEDQGAKADGSTDDTAAIQRAIDACAAAGGGIVRFSPGRTYRSATIRLKSHVTLDLAQGAILSGVTDRTAYRDVGCLIFAEACEDIAITGSGTIEGNGKAYFPTLVEGDYQVPPAFLGYWNPLDEFPGQFHAQGRPMMIILLKCRHVRLAEFRIHDAPTWTIHPIACEDLDVDGITIDNSLLVPNSDGIDIDRCKRVRIANCAITAGDDCIVLKTSRNFPTFGDCEDVTVTNCTLSSSSAGIKIEPEGVGAVRNAVISGCTITRSNRGIAIFNRDGAIIENIILANLVITTEQHHPMWWGAAEPLSLSNLPRRKTMAPGTIRNITVSNVIARGSSGFFLYGWPDNPTEDIVVDNVSITIVRSGKFAGGQYDLRPNEYAQQIYDHAIAGVYAHHLTRLALRDVTVGWGTPLPANAGSAIEIEGVDGLELTNVRGNAAPGSGKPARMIDRATRMAGAVL